MKNKTTIILIFIIIIFFLLVFAQLLNITWSEKILLKSCEPVNSYDPICLIVVNQQKTLGNRLKIKIGLDNYLHRNNIFRKVYFEMNYFEDYYNEFVKSKEFEKAKVEWLNNGIIVEVPLYIWTEDGGNLESKYKLFIPKESFSGGR